MSLEVNMLSGAMAFMFASCKGPEATAVSLSQGAEQRRVPWEGCIHATKL